MPHEGTLDFEMLTIAEAFDHLVGPNMVRYPVEMRLPRGFRPARPSSWPRSDGRWEFVGGRLLYMPPCGDVQQFVAADIGAELVIWARSHPAFVVGTNEAGMLLGGDVRAAEAAVWLKQNLPKRRLGVLPRVAPILAVEVAGTDEGEPQLRAKAQWYLDHGVKHVWLVLPEVPVVIVIGKKGPARLRMEHRIPEVAELPDLSPRVSDFFRQLP